jgi:hypothetical protein
MKNIFSKKQAGRILANHVNLLIMLIMVQIFTACNDDTLQDTAQPGGALQINVTAQGFISDAPSTRAFDAGYTTNLDQGDQIGITAIKGGNVVPRQDNIAFVCDNAGKWSPVTSTDTIFAGADSYLVYYPYDATMTGKATTGAILAAFAPKADQSAPADYTASDLMAGTTGTVSGTTLNVTLEHALALVEVRLPASATILTVNVGGTTVVPCLKDGIYRYIIKPAGTVAVTGSYKSGGKTFNFTKDISPDAGKYAQLNILHPSRILGGYRGNILVTYTDAETESVTVSNIDGAYQLTKGTGRTVKSFELKGKTYFIGRKADEPLVLKFSSDGTIQFRDAVSGFIPIGSYAEFQLINTALSGSYKQEAALDLMNEEWTLIGNNTNRFSGIFDGDGKGISHLKIDKTSQNYIGLFGYNIGTISKVRIISGDVKGGNYVGGVAGYNYGGTITACYNTGTVSGTSDVGGVVGVNEGAITACYNTGTVNGITSNVGGVAGYNLNGTITACYWAGMVYGGIGSGTGSATAFTGSGGGWPAPSTHDAWKLYPEGYWQSLGGWNGGSPVYPKLWFE